MLSVNLCVKKEIRDPMPPPYHTTYESGGVVGVETARRSSLRTG